MTRIAVFSDMQLVNHEPWTHPDLAGADIGRVDLCVVAGDHHPPLSRSLRSLAPLARRLPVVYVPGNRDYYHESLEAATREARDVAADLGITLLQDDVAEVAGVRFVGGTLYTDYALYGEPGEALAHAAERISDHRFVTTEGGPFTPEVAAALHARTRDLIEACLATPYAGPTVVVSHHAPHADCLSPKFVRSISNACFASDLSALLAGPTAPDLWLYGATHHPFDRVVGRTRVVSNPAGYAGEIPDFAFDKVLDLSDSARTRRNA